jgi:hypothetical protein
MGPHTPKVPCCTACTVGRFLCTAHARTEVVSLTMSPARTASSRRSSYSLGESPVLLLQNPWPYAKLLLVWGNEAGVASKVVTAVRVNGRQ